MKQDQPENGREKELVGLSRRISELEMQIQELTDEIVPLKRQRANIIASRSSAEARGRTSHLRNLQIVDEAKALGSELSLRWRDDIAKRHNLSTRHINRILRAADIVIDRWN